jgi:ABC-type branched-subunit amino acid transport system substrate-binding protein
LRAAGALCLALAAFLIFNGCVPAGQKIQDPSMAAGRMDLKVSAEDRAFFLKELSQVKQGPRAAKAEYFLGLAAYQDGQWAEAGKYFKAGAAAGAKGAGWDLACLSMTGALLEKTGDFPGALGQYQRLILPASSVPQASPLAAELSVSALSSAEHLIAGLGLEELVKVMALPLSLELQPALSVRRITLLVADHKIAEAFEAIEDYLKRFPEAPYTAEVNRLAREADKEVPVDRHALGLLLPLTGSQAAYGLQARQGAELALEELNLDLADPDKLKFMPADEGSNTSTAAAAAAKLLTGSQVMAVLGPMASESCLGILPYAASHHTLFLSPSAIRQDLGDSSPYFFRNCLTPEKQGAAMADYAFTELKVTRVAGLYPDSSYGSSLMRAFAGRMEALGGSIVMSVSYTAGSSDFKDLAVELGGVNPTALKDADVAEKRDQQAKVEAASTKLGQHLLDLKAQLEADASRSAQAASSVAVSPVAVSSDSPVAYAPLSFPAKVAVVDFACATGVAQFNSGRAFSDRFWRVLGQLDELKLIPPDETAKRLRERGLRTELMNPSNAADFARALGADFYLGGTVSELTPDWQSLSLTSQQGDHEGRQAKLDIEKFSKNRVFQVTAQLIDARTGQISAWQQFEVLKLQAPEPNGYGLQALYFPGTAAEVLQAASALKFCDMKVQLLGSDLWDRPLLLRNDDVATLEGACFSSGFFPESQEKSVKHFVEAYKRKFASAPNLLSAQAYDAVLMLGSLLKQGVATREELRQGLLGLKNFDGVSGRTSFDGHQDALKRIPILKVNSVSKTLEQVQ